MAKKRTTKTKSYSFKPSCPHCNKIIPEIRAVVYYCNQHGEITVQEIWKKILED